MRGALNKTPQTTDPTHFLLSLGLDLEPVE
jgi:hypothetical protein